MVQLEQANRVLSQVTGMDVRTYSSSKDDSIAVSIGFSLASESLTRGENFIKEFEKEFVERLLSSRCFKSIRDDHDREKEGLVETIKGLQKNVEELTPYKNYAEVHKEIHGIGVGHAR